MGATEGSVSSADTLRELYHSDGTAAGTDKKSRKDLQTISSYYKYSAAPSLGTINLRRESLSSYLLLLSSDREAHG
jgi:hypothetical protein